MDLEPLISEKEITTTISQPSPSRFRSIVNRMQLSIERKRNRNRSMLIYKLINNNNNSILSYLLAILPPADAAALALTCKTIWKSLGGDQSGLRKLLHQKDDYISFWERMEDRFPKRIFCHSCGVFHRYKCSSRVWPMVLEPCYYQAALLLDSLGPVYLPFAQAKQYMNYYRYRYRSKPKWVPLRRIFILCRRYTPSAYKSYAEFSSKVVDDELWIKVDISTLFKRQEIDTLKQSVDWRLFGEMTKDKHWHSFLEDEFTELKNYDVYYQCTTCSSEKNFSINLESTMRRGEARYTAWYNTGPCNRIFDTKWLLAAECIREPHRLDRISLSESQRFSLPDVDTCARTVRDFPNFMLHIYD